MQQAREPLTLLIDRLETPIGELLLLADTAGNLRAVDWSDYESRMLRLLRLHYGDGAFRLTPGSTPILRTRMGDYFKGHVEAIEDLPVQTGGTSFQRQVWNALRTIPCGSTVSYRDLAEQVGKPAAVRAVGLANGANPVSIVVPCHRVVGANGSLTGYAGGLERKRWLLDHERMNRS